MLIITALTEKGKEVMKIQDKKNKVGDLAMKVLGVKVQEMSEEPYIIRVTFGRCPDVVKEQIEIALITKFEELGALKGIDFKTGAKE